MKGEFSMIGIVLFLIVASGVITMVFGANVTYDHRSLIIDGRRRMLICGSIHYSRSTPEMWPDLIQKAKDGGLDAIHTNVFWNFHEYHHRKEADFEGRKDLVKFVKLVKEAGLYAFIGMGPHVGSNWNYGGLPFWLRTIPGIAFRGNYVFQDYAKDFMVQVVERLKKENLFAYQGGPIILCQIENNYYDMYSATNYGDEAKSYVRWAADLATLVLDTRTPWVMSNQPDTPDPLINTFDGLGFLLGEHPNSDKKPTLWTSCLTGRYLAYGDVVMRRLPTNLAYDVGSFFQRGGSFVNYYMYHGGTNFGRTAGGPFIAASYDYDAPIDEYGLLHQPTWGHLKELHKAIKLCEEAMVATDPSITSVGTDLQSAVYKTDSGLCAAILTHDGNATNATVTLNGGTYYMPPYSVSILPDCKNVVFNSGKINSVATVRKFLNRAAPWKWSWISEPVGATGNSSFTKMGLQEQVNITGDKSDYLWYSQSINITGKEPFLNKDLQTTLHIISLGHVLHAFVNGKLAGTGYNAFRIVMDELITLNRGINKIDLLSSTVGLKYEGLYYDVNPQGINGPVQLQLEQNASVYLNLSSQMWTYQAGLIGEELGLPTGNSSLWDSQLALPKNQPLVWYKTTFDAPYGNSPVALDLSAMGKGEAWVNGQSIGRYWPKNLAPTTGCEGICDGLCKENCGKPSQTMYHVPRAWLQPRGNVLVLFDEMGGDPTRISFAARHIGSVCTVVSETHPPPIDMWINSTQKAGRTKPGPTASLECPYANQVISNIRFASFGNPSGKCGSFGHGRCTSNKAHSVVRKACLGSHSCHIEVSAHTFGDPCPGVRKSLAVAVSCK